MGEERKWEREGSGCWMWYRERERMLLGRGLSECHERAGWRTGVGVGTVIRPATWRASASASALSPLTPKTNDHHHSFKIRSPGHQSAASKQDRRLPPSAFYSNAPPALSSGFSPSFPPHLHRTIIFTGPLPSPNSHLRSHLTVYHVPLLTSLAIPAPQ